MEVQILSRKLITPSSPTPNDLQNLTISSLDQLPPASYVTCIFYYPAKEEEHGINNAERSEKLQKSLSEILTLFYPLGGRYNKDNLFIDCNDKGAEYLEAQVDCCLSQLLREEDLRKELENHLVPHPCEPDYNPLLLVQFNKFECGGLAIGVWMTHRIADAFTFFTFINAWAVACRIGIDQVDYPSFQLASFCPPKDVSAIKRLDIWREKDNKKIVLKRFEFDGATTSNLKAIASGSELLKHRPTRVEVVTALMWMTLIKVSQIKHSCLRPSLMILPVNMRGRVILPIPENSCGNLVGPATAQLMPDNDGKVHFHNLVGLIHDAIKGTVIDYAKATDGDELFFTLTNAVKEINETIDKYCEVDAYIFTSWTRCPIYEADFGWGKPDRVTNVQAELENTVLLVDTKDGDGIEAWVVLEENNMLLFQQNLDITALSGQEQQLGQLS